MKRILIGLSVACVLSLGLHAQSDPDALAVSIAYSQVLKAQVQLMQADAALRSATIALEKALGCPVASADFSQQVPQCKPVH